jgi:pyruvate kinase
MDASVGPANPTKIVCTLGPASDSEDMIRSLTEAGMDVARLNFSHGDHATHQRTFERVRRVGAQMGHHTAILADLQGPKMRVGLLEQGHPVVLKPGEQVVIDTAVDTGDANRLSTTYERLALDTQPGQRILIDDGLIELKTLSATDSEVTCEVIFGGEVREHAGINLPGAAISAPSLTEKDRCDLEFALDLGVDYVALSFVRAAADVRMAKRAIGEAGSDTPVVAKLEKPEALQELTEVVQVSDVVMVARGDLGVEMSPGDVPVLQKRIIAECRRQRVPVITATQMLDSMREHPRPTRAEASDVANAIFDGTDAVMLSGETAIGKYPVQSVEMMRTIATTAEREQMRTDLDLEPLELRESHGFADAVSRAAVETAESLGAVAVIAFTQSGSTARLASKCRPKMAIVAATPSPETARRCNLYWGVEPVLIEPVDDTDQMIDNIDRALRSRGMACAGDVVVITAGTPIGERGSTNLMKVHVIGK